MLDKFSSIQILKNEIIKDQILKNKIIKDQINKPKKYDIGKQKKIEICKKTPKTEKKIQINFSEKEKNPISKKKIIKIISLNENKIKNLQKVKEYKKFFLTKKNKEKENNFSEILKKIFNLSLGYKIKYLNKNWTFFLYFNNSEIIICESDINLKIKKMKNFLSLFLIKYFFKDLNILFPINIDFSKRLEINEEISKLIIFENNKEDIVFEYLKNIEKKSSVNEKFIPSSSTKKFFSENKNKIVKDQNLLEIKNISKSKILKDDLENKKKLLKKKQEKLKVLEEKKKKILQERNILLKQEEDYFKIKKKNMYSYKTEKFKKYIDLLKELKEKLNISSNFEKYIKKKQTKNKSFICFENLISNRKKFKFFSKLLKTYFKNEFNKNFHFFFFYNENDDEDSPRKIIFRFAKSQKEISSLVSVKGKQERLFVKYLFLNVIVNYFQIWDYEK